MAPEELPEVTPNPGPKKTKMKNAPRLCPPPPFLRLTHLAERSKVHIILINRLATTVQEALKDTRSTSQQN
jgi:hypothetical protein